MMTALHYQLHAECCFFITSDGVMAMKRNSVSYLLVPSAIQHVQLTQGDGEKQGQKELC